MLPRPDRAQGGVVRLRRAGREDDLGRLDAEEAGDGYSCILDGVRGSAPVVVGRRRVAEVARKVWKHGLDDTPVARRRGGGVGRDTPPPDLHPSTPFPKVNR